ncbi:hypothetical protein F3Y22_tig00111441pilonHSYRG00014 [Hibiscus syriacus]|uniref:AB hydrolase-1 domain-containing protein n=1 Tax=Hibiscus syriacus TaxID=106335 RepID=A0A6A2Y371_HIBSY|nr:hypothetical protein F3Y22_tig00111441pilonHSYRG00014 [Hibiscus syriacus]
MEGIQHSIVNVNGITMHVAEKGQGPVILFLHGFPEIWYTWRHQILALSSLGYRTFAPDLRGYGDTEAPSSITSYSCMYIVGDLIALVDTLGVDQVFLVAHDWVPLSDDDLSYYTNEFNQKGFTGALNYYRTFDLNWELTAPWSGAQVKLPVKYNVGDLDTVYTTPGVKEYVESGGFKGDVPMLDEVVVMEGVGHFINQERADEINSHILDFIQKF